MSGMLIFLVAPERVAADDASAQSENAGKYWISARLRNEDVGVGHESLGGDGSEIDMVATRKFGDHFLGGLKFADFSADQHGVETQRIWLFG